MQGRDHVFFSCKGQYFRLSLLSEKVEANSWFTLDNHNTNADTAKLLSVGPNKILSQAFYIVTALLTFLSLNVWKGKAFPLSPVDIASFGLLVAS